MAHDHTSPAQGLGFFNGRPMTPFAAVALKVVVAIAKWEAHARTRTHLKHLDDHLLRDIGVTRDAANTEAARSFWQG